MGKHHAPLVVYSKTGERHVVGEGVFEIDLNPISQEMEIVGSEFTITDKAFGGRICEALDGSYSIDWGTDV